MKKFLGYLERYVEFICLGLGVLYLLWMVWGYVINTPAQKTIGTAAVTPGSVDSYIADNTTKQLESKLNEKDQAVSFNTTPLTPMLTGNLAGGGFEPQEAPAYAWDVTPMTPLDVQNPGGNKKVQAVVLKLPTPNAVKIVDAESGRSTVMIPQTTPPAAGGAANVPVVPAVNNGQPQGTRTDRDWVTVFFNLDVQALNKQWAESFPMAKLGPDVIKTAFMSADLVRQEVDAKGANVGPEVVVARLVTNPMPPMPPSPIAPTDKGIAAAYESWATGHTVEIVAPPFYPLGQLPSGDAWKTLAMWQAPPPPPPQPVAPPPPPPPVRRVPRGPVGPPEGYPGGYGGPPPGAIPTGPPGGYRGGPRGGYRVVPGPSRADLVVNDPDRPIEVAAGPTAPPYGPPPGAIRYGPPPGAFPGGPPPGAFPGGAYPPGYPSEGEMPEMPNQPQGPQGAPPTVPNGLFNPGELKQNIDGYLHDASEPATPLRPGHSYKYKVRYSLLNPMFNKQPGWVAQPEWVNLLVIKSLDSDWSKTVTIPPKTYFFCSTGGAPSPDKVTFDVFTWFDGQWKKSQVKASGGDVVGAGLGQSPDFSTGYTVVDVRHDRRERAVVVLVDDAGNFERRDGGRDAVSPKYKELLDATNPPKPPANNAAAANAGPFGQLGQP